MTTPGRSTRRSRSPTSATRPTSCARVYDESDGADGFASIEVEPDLADDTEATTARARELWGRLERPNVFIKIPATEAGIPAIEAAIAEGINVNVTLMFSVEMYSAWRAPTSPG